MLPFGIKHLHTLILCVKSWNSRTFRETLKFFQGKSEFKNLHQIPSKYCLFIRLHIHKSWDNNWTDPREDTVKRVEGDGKNILPKQALSLRKSLLFVNFCQAHAHGEACTCAHVLEVINTQTLCILHCYWILSWAGTRECVWRVKMVVRRRGDCRAETF